MLKPPTLRNFSICPAPMPATTSTTSHTARNHQRYRQALRASHEYSADMPAPFLAPREHFPRGGTRAEGGRRRQLLLHCRGVGGETVVPLAIKARQSHGRQGHHVGDAIATSHQRDLAEVLTWTKVGHGYRLTCHIRHAHLGLARSDQVQGIARLILMYDDGPRRDLETLHECAQHVGVGGRDAEQVGYVGHLRLASG